MLKDIVKTGIFPSRPRGKPPFMIARGKMEDVKPQANRNKLNREFHQQGRKGKERYVNQ